jgi:hypothetical protein
VTKDKGDDAHLTRAPAAAQGQNLEDARQEKDRKSNRRYQTFCDARTSMVETASV